MHQLIKLPRRTGRLQRLIRPVTGFWRPKNALQSWAATGRRYLFGAALALISFLLGCQQKADLAGQAHQPPGAAVRVVRTAQGGYVLQNRGRRLRLRGAAGLEHFDQIRLAGGNSVRLWSTDYAGPLLDEAQRQGLTVMLGLWMAPETSGFDYYDARAVQVQLEELRAQVLRYRRHPALLMWCVGNELDLDAKNPKVYAAVNDVARLIHALDPDHPVATAMTTTLALVPALKRWAPAVDVLAVNSFGKLQALPAAVRYSGWDGPYIVTEFGGPGYWPSESAQTPWNAPLELNSAAKAAFAGARYQRVALGDSARCLGAYAFFWGHKLERTPTWFSCFTAAGEKTALVDEMHRLWRGREPANRVPEITLLTLAGRRDVNFPRLRRNTTYEASFQATDPEGQLLTARWELWPEQPAVPDSLHPLATEPLTGHLSAAANGRVRLRTPTQAGAYRLLLWVSDGQGGAATANIPFYCSPAASVRQMPD